MTLNLYFKYIIMLEEELNQLLRQRDKVKDDAIIQLSDQLVALSVRLHEIERRQGSGLAAGITA
jgi:hypothetical protein